MNNLNFREGQRVYAPAEPYLGLGIVKSGQGRRFVVSFLKTGDIRTYSQDTEALLRYRAKNSDWIIDSKGDKYKVVRSLENDGLVTYIAEGGARLPENMLACELRAPDPFATLVLGQPGAPADFVRRLRAHRFKAKGRSQAYRGLGAARVQLLPHQLYVAERIAKMWRPRVLLADEVGLGKTIEAGLIAVRMAALGRISSLAVVAPRPLVGQWLAEFYRRFSRPLVLFDAELEELPRDLLIAADDLDFLPPNFRRDMLIVDEAHHYADEARLKEIAARSEAVLLLSATPSLGGQDRLFTLLHLLDPLRYSSLKSLRESSHRWREVAGLAQAIEGGASIGPIDSQLRQLFPDEDDLPELLQQARGEELLDRLMDRHGLGRSLVRNRRARLSSLFAGRRLRAYRLKPQEKPIDFVVEFLKSKAALGEKVLMMVATPESVARWDRVLKRKAKLLLARFDETMSLLERDRQAAWFNRQDNAVDGESAQVLICSEIGGEGRNFQVAHHLLLLDLPDHPDSLEQRIGRLDRIGQLEVVEVHVPLAFDNARDLVCFQWLNQGLNAFYRPLSEGQRALDRFGAELARWEKLGPGDGFEGWLAEVRSYVEELEDEAKEAIDPLIDRMSYREPEAVKVCELVAAEQADILSQLELVLPDLLDSLGVVMEAQGLDGIYSIKPGDMMFVDALPGMPPEGCQVTLRRAVANAREDVDFLHFEHRLTQGTLDLIIDEGVGRATAARWRGAPATTVLFQLLLIWEVDAPARLGIDRFMPSEAMVFTSDLQGSMWPGLVFPDGPEVVEDELERLGVEVVETLLQRTEEIRSSLFERALIKLEGTSERLLKQAREKLEVFFDGELQRLKHLSQTDELGRDGEALYEEAIGRLAGYRQDCLQALSCTSWRFDAVRLILCQAVV